MTRKKIIWDEKGKRKEVKAGQAGGGWLPPQHMRGLPGDYITKDPSDGDRIYETDDPHIVEDLIAQHDKKYQEAPKKSTLEQATELAEEQEQVAFTQENIDWLRFKTIKNLVEGAIKQKMHGYANEIDLGVRYLWFDKPDFDSIGMRKGNPPPDSERPKHLRNLNLVVDVTNWPVRIKTKMLERGIQLPDTMALIQSIQKIQEHDIRVDDLPLEGLQ